MCPLCLVIVCFQLIFTNFYVNILFARAVSAANQYSNSRTVNTINKHHTQAVHVSQKLLRNDEMIWRQSGWWSQTRTDRSVVIWHNHQRHPQRNPVFVNWLVVLVVVYITVLASSVGYRLVCRTPSDPRGSTVPIPNIRSIHIIFVL